jgi:hypothetical protein
MFDYSEQAHSRKYGPAQFNQSHRDELWAACYVSARRALLKRRAEVRVRLKV